VTREAYRRSGVDVAAGEEAVARIRERVEATFGPAVLTGLGGFAAAVAMPAGMRDPVLVSATDGVGTKTDIAARLGRYDTIGIDLVAMCADDVACLGAAPFFFLDYISVGHVDPAVVTQLVSGIAAGCGDAGCALVGGETAEHPGLLADDRGFDLAGFCVGIVERADLIDRPAGEPGDLLIGLASSGLHSTGYSLVRQLMVEHDIDIQAPYVEFVRRTGGEGEVARLGAEDPVNGTASLGDVLLTPTQIYAQHLLALRDGLRTRQLAVRGFAHITGGGLPGNVPRALADGAAARLDPSRWAVPSVIRFIAALGGLDAAEMRATFNGGIGMVAVVEANAAQPAINLLADRGVRAWQIGEVVVARGSERYEEAPLSGRPLS
jgi:phosphoribosylformylglycinamidine cyclo-ligase